MKRLSRQKIQLIVNLGLTVFTLFALIVSVFAWFSANKYSKVDTLQMRVERSDITVLEKPESYLFPCATKITKISENAFNAESFVKGTYIIEGEGQVFADFLAADENGILGYVLKDGEDENRPYDAIVSSLKEHFGVEDLTAHNYSYADLKAALHTINTSQPVGQTIVDPVTGEINTKITLICWADYDSFASELNKTDTEGLYVYMDKTIHNIRVRFFS